MFKKILIANRGEIACRIMRTANRMGVECVAVFSEADRNAMHVRMAQEAICVGSAASADSYLRVDRVLDAAQKSGALFGVRRVQEAAYLRRELRVGAGQPLRTQPVCLQSTMRGAEDPAVGVRLLDAARRVASSNLVRCTPCGARRTMRRRDEHGAQWLGRSASGLAPRSHGGREPWCLRTHGHRRDGP